jgi:dihydroorotase
LTVDLVLNDARAYVNKEIVDCCLAIDNGKIAKIGKESNMPKAQTRIDLKNLLVLPGLIDAHVHLRDEGKAYKEDFFTGTAAAACGGLTTVLDMPNNEPVTMSAQTLRGRMEKAESKILVNVGFFSEFPPNLKEIAGIVKEGAGGFKLFLVEQIGGLNIDDDNALSAAFKIVQKLSVPVAVHAEDKNALEKIENKLKQSNSNDIEAFLQAHSEKVEAKAIQRILNITKRTKTRTHFCHVSTKSGLETIIHGKKSGLPVACEVTPHHLFLSDSDLRRIGTLTLTLPPFREKHNAAFLWNGIREKWVDILASDHAPHTLQQKMATIVWDVKVGIPGLETMLPLVLTEVKRKRLALADIISLMAERPAEIFGLKGKGFLKEGNMADLTVVDLKRKWRIDAAKFQSKAKYSPFDGRVVEGKPVKTFVNGQLVMDEGEIVASVGSGRIIRGRPV